MGGWGGWGGIGVKKDPYTYFKKGPFFDQKGHFFYQKGPFSFPLPWGAAPLGFPDGRSVGRSVGRSPGRSVGRPGRSVAPVGRSVGRSVGRWPRSVGRSPYGGAGTYPRLLATIQNSLSHRSASFGAKRESNTMEVQLRRHSGSTDLGSSKIGPCIVHTRQR